MPKYKLTVVRVCHEVAQIEIEAASKKDAQEIFWDEVSWVEDLNWEWTDSSNEEIIEVEQIG